MTATPCLHKIILAAGPELHKSGGNMYLLIKPENSGTAFDTEALKSASGDVNVKICGSHSPTPYLRLCHGQGKVLHSM